MGKIKISIQRRFHKVKLSNLHKIEKYGKEIVRKSGKNRENYQQKRGKLSHSQY